MGIPHPKMLERFVGADDVTRSWGLQYFPRGRRFAFFLRTNFAPRFVVEQFSPLQRFGGTDGFLVGVGVVILTF